MSAPADRAGPDACDACLRRTSLLQALAGHLDAVRGRIEALLALSDDELIEAVGGDERAALRGHATTFDPETARGRCAATGLEAICRCDPGYPPPLLALPAPPAVLHVAGGLARLTELIAEDPVAVVGARRASAYGLDVARSLAGELGTAGVTVVSGMALGVDAAAHQGALGAGGATVAVLAGGADRPYPATHRRLYASIRERGAIVSELGPGVVARRWMFPARNRIIAALSAMTVVVQARERSGALVTARWADRLGRTVGAVPGPVTSPQSVGPHALLASGAALIAGGQDVLDGLYGVGACALPDRRRDLLDPALSALLDAIVEGEEGDAAFAAAGLDADGGLAALASLELAGMLRRGAGGRYSVRW